VTHVHAQTICICIYAHIYIHLGKFPVYFGLSALHILKYSLLYFCGGSAPAPPLGMHNTAHHMFRLISVTTSHFIILVFVIVVSLIVLFIHFLKLFHKKLFFSQFLGIFRSNCARFWLKNPIFGPKMAKNGQ